MVHRAIHQEHAHVFAGGSPSAPASLPAHLREGFYFQPTVLGVSTKSEIWREEVSLLLVVWLVVWFVGCV